MSIKDARGRVGAPVGGERVGVGWRVFLWFAALFNFAMGIASMVLPEATVDDRVIGVLVICFGIVYGIVASDPRRFAPVLWAGVIGKIGVVALLAPAVLGPPFDAMMAAVLGADALFTLGFVVLLMRRIDSTV